LTLAATELSSTIDAFISAIADLKDRRSAIRYLTNRNAIVTRGGTRHETQMIDASATGAKIIGVPDLAAGMSVADTFARSLFVDPIRLSKQQLCRIKSFAREALSKADLRRCWPTRRQTHYWSKLRVVEPC